MKKKVGGGYFKKGLFLSVRIKCLSLRNNFDFKNIENIEIETFSFCNRQCWFCPNSIIDRHTGNIEMEEELYLHILEQLAEIDFSGKVSFSRYNEPLAKRELILKRIRQAREVLPKATLAINTNGDYLTKNYIEDLYDAGLNFLNIQHYLHEKEKFEVDDIEKCFETISTKIDLSYKVSRKKSDRIEVEFNHPHMKIMARARDFKKNGCTRGNLLKTMEKSKRQYGCLIPYTSVYIDYNGMVVPCCNIRSDFQVHSDYILGDSNKERLSEIFNNTKTRSFRRKVKIRPYIDICKDCSFCDSYAKYMNDLDYIIKRQRDVE